MDFDLWIQTAWRTIANNHSLYCKIHIQEETFKLRPHRSSSPYPSPPTVPCWVHSCGETCPRGWVCCCWYSAWRGDLCCCATLCSSLAIRAALSYVSRSWSSAGDTSRSWQRRTRMHQVVRREPPWLVMVSFQEVRESGLLLSPAHQIICSFVHEYWVLHSCKKHTQEIKCPCFSVLLFPSHTADLKRTIAVLLDDILTRLVKLEGKIELVANTSSTNTSHPAGGVLASAPAAVQKSSKQETPGNNPGTSRLRPHVPNRPLQPQGV